MARQDEESRPSGEAERKFQEIVKPPTEDTEIGSGGGGGSTGPGVTGIAGTGAANTTGTNVGTTSTGATGTGGLDTGTGVTGAGSAENLGGAGTIAGGATRGSTGLSPSGVGVGPGNPGPGEGPGSGDSLDRPRGEIGEGDINPSAAHTEGMPMRSGPASVGMDNTEVGPTGRAAHRSAGGLGSGTGAVGGLGAVGTSSLGPQHMRDPMESGRRNPTNELTPDDRGGAVGRAGGGTGISQTQEPGDSETTEE